MEPEVIENLDSQNEAPAQEAGETAQQFTEREKQYYERIKTLEGKLKEKETTKPNLPEPKQGLSVDQRVDLRLEGYSKDDIVFIERAMSGRSLDETLSDPHVKASLDTIKTTRATVASTPEPSTTVPTFTAEKKTWAQMSPAERKANYQQALGTLQRKSGTRVE